MKRLSLLTILLAYFAVCSAYDFTAVSPSGHTLCYNIVNGEAQVTSEDPSPSLPYGAYDDLQGDVVIPDSVTFGGTTYPVTSLGKYAFLFCPDLHQLTLPATIRVIGPYAIATCQGLDSVSIPNTVQVIDTGAFSASFIRSIRIPDSVTVIPYRAFRNCSRLKSVTLHDRITKIEAGAFSWCSGLPDLMIPASIAIESASSEDNAAFYNVQHIEYHGSSAGAPWGALWMNGLRDGNFVFNGPARDTIVSWIGHGSEVTIPSSVKVLNGSVFYNAGLTSVTMPATMTTIGERAFQGCNLSEINLPDSLTTIGANAFYGSHGLTSLTIPDAVTSIGEYAFFECTGLTSITLGTGLKSIGQRAFMDCSGVESITIPDSVASIGSNAFGGVPHIEYHGNATGAPWGAKTMNGVQEGDYLYYDTTYTTILAYLGSEGQVTVPDGVITIGATAFKDNTGLYKVELPATVATIEDEAFSGCSNLLMVTLPDTMESIGSSIFDGCSSLVSLVWPQGVSEIPAYAFYSCESLASVRIPNTVTSIGMQAFCRCKSLTSITLPDSLQNLENFAFCYCEGLTSVTIPEGVTTISSSAFRLCSHLKSVTLPSTIESIKNYGFSACSELEEITCHALTAPTPTANSFNSVDSAVVVNIPCGSTASYQAAWPRFHNFSETAPYAFSATTIDPALGSVTILTAPSCQDTAVVEATPAAGYLFARWNDGNTDNPRSLVLTADTHLVAIFGVLIQDTVPYYDTIHITVYDTIHIYDTIIVSIDQVQMIDAKVYVQNGDIVVEGAEGNDVALYDATGRLLATRRDDYQPLRFPVPATGTYFVSIANRPARKVLIAK